MEKKFNVDEFQKRIHQDFERKQMKQQVMREMAAEKQARVGQVVRGRCRERQPLRRLVRLGLVSELHQRPDRLDRLVAEWHDAAELTSSAGAPAPVALYALVSE